MAGKVQFTNSQMLKWMEYVADMQGVSAEKIKMLNTCSKRRILQILHILTCYINAGKQDMVIMKCTLVKGTNLLK